MYTRGSSHHRNAIDVLSRTARELGTLLSDLLRLGHGDSWELNVANGRLTVHRSGLEVLNAHG